MIALLKIGRWLMVVWIMYGLVEIFVPSLLHQTPDQTGGIIQVGVAFAAGYLLDRAISAVRRRRAMHSERKDSDYSGKDI